MQSIRLGVFALPCDSLQQKGQKIQLMLFGKLGKNAFKFLHIIFTVIGQSLHSGK